MTGSGTKLIAIDGERSHLADLTARLGRKGVTCRLIRFEGDATVVPRHPDVRIILARKIHHGLAAGRDTKASVC